jgi:hypothetical protein
MPNWPDHASSQNPLSSASRPFIASNIKVALDRWPMPLDGVVDGLDVALRIHQETDLTAAFP